MATYPLPLCLVPTGRRRQLLPEIPIGDPFSAAVEPPPTSPLRKVSHHPLLQIPGVRDHGHVASRNQCSQPEDRGRTFHPVIRRVQLPTSKNVLVLSVSQDARPSTGDRISHARSVREEHYFLQAACLRFIPHPALGRLTLSLPSVRALPVRRAPCPHLPDGGPSSSQT